ncbi:dispersed gene family protein 1 (DGF-1), putative, partial [Trypanosoma cruzi]
MLLAKGNV